MTPNMSLIKPVIGVSTGLAWEQAFNSNADIVDNHNHAPGYGSPIPIEGLNINNDLNFNSLSITNLNSLGFAGVNVVAASRIYMSVSGDLWFNNSAGTPVQITLGNAVNATSSGISSGTASAAFSAGVLQVYANAGTTTPANILVGSILLGNNLPASKFLTLSPPAAMAANIAQRLPTIPAAQNIMTMDASGNMAAAWNVDGSTIVVSGNTIEVPAGGITRTQLAAVGQQISPTCLNFSSNSTTPVAVTNLSVTITSSGRPLIIALISDQSFPAYVGNSGNFETTLSLYRGGSFFTSWAYSAVGASSFKMAPGVFMMDVPVAGTYTYDVRINTSNAAANALLNDCKLMVYEL